VTGPEGKKEGHVKRGERGKFYHGYGAFPQRNQEVIRKKKDADHRERIPSFLGLSVSSWPTTFSWRGKKFQE